MSEEEMAMAAKIATENALIELGEQRQEEKMKDKEKHNILLQKEQELLSITSTPDIATKRQLCSKINEYINMEDRQYALLSDGCDDEEQSDGEEHDEEQSDGEEHDEEQSDGDEHDEEQDDLDVDEIIDTLQQDETHEKEQPEVESNSVKELKKKNKELQQRCNSLEKDKKRLERVLSKIKSMTD